MGIDFNKMVNGPEKVVVDSGPEFRIAKVAVNAGPVAVPAPYDLKKARAAFRGFDGQIDKVKSSITGFEIITDADAGTFTETVGLAKRIINSIEVTRKEIIAKPDKFVRAVNSFVLVIRKRLEAVEKTGKQKIGEYNYKQEIKRREKEKEMQDEANRKQKEIDNQAQSAGVPSVTLPPMVAPQKIDPIRTETATGSTRYKKVFEVVDFARLDDAFKMVDDKKLQSAIDAGLRPTGIKIKEVPIVSIRSN